MTWEVEAVRMSEEHLNGDVNTERPKKSVRKPFLKKGSGLARFYRNRFESSHSELKSEEKIKRNDPSKLQGKKSSPGEERFILNSIEKDEIGENGDFEEKYQDHRSRELLNTTAGEEIELELFEIMEKMTLDNSFALSAYANEFLKIPIANSSKSSNPNTSGGTSKENPIETEEAESSGEEEEEEIESEEDEDDEDEEEIEITDHETDRQLNDKKQIEESHESSESEEVEEENFSRRHNSSSLKNSMEQPKERVEKRDLRNVSNYPSQNVSKNPLNESEDEKLRYSAIVLQSRIFELEEEIRRVRHANKKAAQLEERYHQKGKALDVEKEEFIRYKRREMKSIEAARGRLEEERLLFRKDLEAESKKTNFLSTLTQENQMLKEKVSLMESEFKRKENKWVVGQRKLQEKLKSLEEIVKVLQEENARKSKRNFQPRTKIPVQNKAPKLIVDSGSDVSSKASKEEEDEGIEIIHPNGDRETKFNNGTRMIETDMESQKKIKWIYFNGDIKEIYPDSSIKYFYAESSTWQTTYSDGLDVYEFSNGQIERKHPDGKSEILYPNGCIKYIFPDGKEECIFPDKTILKTEASGEKSLTLPNGQKEFYRDGYKMRVYLDGTKKIVYSDGSHETRYTSGRIRVKDKDGKLVHDGFRSQVAAANGK